MIWSKKVRDKLLSTLLENETVVYSGIGFVEKYRTDCNQSLPIKFSSYELTVYRMSFHHRSEMLFLIKLFFLRFGYFLFLATMEPRIAFDSLLMEFRVFILLSKFSLPFSSN